MNDTLNLFGEPDSDADVRWLEQTLDLCRDWMTARQLGLASANRFDDRGIRAIAASSPNVIMGQRGYRHLNHATTDEITNAANRLESQARKMQDRAIAIRRRAHSMVG